MSIKLFAFALLLFAFGACTHSLSSFYPEIVPKKSEAILSVNASPNHELNLLYLGSGNLILEQNGEAIITDPFFSNQKLMKLLGKVKSNPSRYNTWKTNYEYFLSPSVVQAGLVSHTHYDHAMDLPLLLEDRYFTNLKVVYGNDYLPEIIQNFSDEGVRLAALQQHQVYDPTNSPNKEYEWISVTPRIRFLPVLSNHAPHTKRKLYMDKPLEEDYFDDNLIYSNSKTKAFKWSTGDTYSFLIDFIDTDTLRVFLQTSASQHPFGFPPTEELDQKNVDLAILCYASALNVREYPNAIVNCLKPDKVMFVHWEDFFRTPKSFDDQRMVRSTNPKKVRGRINKLQKPGDYFMMPKPGTRVKIRY